MLRKLLIIDDSPVARKILRKCLPDRSYEIQEAADGKKGVEAFQRQRPDVTFLDLTMPVMDGFQALEKIRDIDPAAVVIVCTADVQAKVQARVLDLGAFHLIKKPPSKDYVNRILDQVEAKLTDQVEVL